MLQDVKSHMGVLSCTLPMIFDVFVAIGAQPFASRLDFDIVWLQQL